MTLNPLISFRYPGGCRKGCAGKRPPVLGPRAAWAQVDARGTLRARWANVARSPR
jgi:hypothetical protein